ncbi:MAG: hypothetical protein ABWW66_01285 [Archaeoglobaceae archaeon]
MRVAWDASLGEFSINDYYYFSKLKAYAEREGIEIEEVSSFYKLGEYDVIVFNYPEKLFKQRLVARVNSWLKKGKKVIMAAYYNNFDGVAENVNRVAVKHGVRVNYDVITDPEKNAGDEMFPVVEWNGTEVLMPCSASVSGGEAYVAGRKVFAAKSGGLLVLGTCVFWDNYSIDFKGNREFALTLLSGDF